MVATAPDGCHATTTYLWTDAKGAEHSTMSAVVNYTFTPTDDGSGVYVKALGYDRQWEESAPKGMRAILEQQTGAEAAAAAEQKKRDGERQATIAAQQAEMVARQEEQRKARADEEQARRQQYQANICRQHPNLCNAPKIDAGE